MAVDRPDVVLNKALRLPAFEKLKGRRVVLASGSPRRKDILETAVSCFCNLLAVTQGLVGPASRNCTIDFCGESAKVTIHWPTCRISDCDCGREGQSLSDAIADPVRLSRSTSGFSRRMIKIPQTW